MTQESLFPDIKTEKIFTPRAIFIASFFGGPLVAGYMIASNYSAFEERKNVIKTWIITAVATIAIVALSYVITYRSTRHIPGYLFPVIYSTITYNIANLLQKTKISGYLSSGGQLQSSGRVFAITIIGLVISFVGMLFIANAWDLMNY